MEAFDNTKIPSFLVDIFSFQIIFDLICTLSSFFLGSWILLCCQFQLSGNSEVTVEQKSTSHDLGKRQIICNSKEDAEDDSCTLLGQEINMVIERIGIKHILEEELEKRWGLEEICGIFEEEPSLQEVREAFDVYDQNKDGFIDAEELHRVLCGLGLRQGLDMQSCNKMIELCDENRDGKIDFNEFVKFMSISL